ncbi:transcriptional regulator [Staphylococcus pseudintermedius]|uniref:transcriptional activator RinB n=1 Tax=Staphylococcus pseudintermedius TaxID=283734 RepID=UPI000D72D310|nr:transcriptional regulator [Staphylococcus pseudintermedius]MCE5674281.1 transcriptional regulator [Staphylococcus pseudintermedius]MCE5766708.1 transcriptional regulator [Staphylococcus pseudintermedius]MDT0813646.1 transcriptional regulator [Staphylococcus pseudintermedius]PWZ62197.1 transcriptional regulator [Staphylococcus pseudintermedius]HAR5688055.1 transcriptional regulator [Staphylococcus pseudintermedius]
MIKRIINLLITLALYELGKYLTEQLIIILTANDEVDTFNLQDHIDLNNVRAEVSE